jgi:hypothetical protein
MIRARKVAGGRPTLDLRKMLVLPASKLNTRSIVWHKPQTAQFREAANEPNRETRTQASRTIGMTPKQRDVYGRDAYGPGASSLRADSVAQVCLALLGELQASLESSQTALLALNVAGTEQGTREQMRLRLAFETLIFAEFTYPQTGLPGEPWHGEESQKRELSKEEFPDELRSCTPELSRRLRAAAERTRELARVQAALLRKSQQFLCVLTNWMAGPGTVYGPHRAASPVVLADPIGCQARGLAECRH